MTVCFSESKRTKRTEIAANRQLNKISRSPFTIYHLAANRLFKKSLKTSITITS